MGLDSVELVMELEKAFGITIPDREAERMYNSHDVLRYVAAARGLDTGTSVLQTDALETLLNALRAATPGLTDITAETPAVECLPVEHAEAEHWLKQSLGLDIPDLREMYPPAHSGLIPKLFGFAAGDAAGTITVRHLCDAINAYNYPFERGNPGMRTVYEAWLVIMLVVDQKIGIPFLEQAPDKNFVHDYGIS